MSEPTPEQQAAICAALARAMGWFHFPNNRWGQYWWPPDKDAAQSEPPNPFISAADSRALLCWLAADDARWTDFYAWFVVEGLSLHPGSDSPIAVVREVMTAHLPVIAMAAHSAITE